MRSILDYIKVFKNIEMYKDPKLRYASIPDASDPDLEQSEPLRPGETLETWKPNPFLKPHAEGGRAGYNDGNTVLPEPNPLSQEERNQKVFNDYVERFKEYLKGSKMPEWFVKDLIKEKAKELGIELADGGRAGYNDGQLVRPTVDGSRPGYGDKYITPARRSGAEGFPGQKFYDVKDDSYSDGRKRVKTKEYKAWLDEQKAISKTRPDYASKGFIRREGSLIEIAEAFKKADIEDDLEYLMKSQKATKEQEVYQGSKMKKYKKGKLLNKHFYYLDTLEKNPDNIQFIADYLDEDADWVLKKLDDRNNFVKKARTKKDIMKKDIKYKKPRNDYLKVENWVQKNAKKYSTPESFEKALRKRFGNKNQFIVDMGSNKTVTKTYFSAGFKKMMLNAEPGSGIKPHHLKQFIKSSLYNFNPKIKAKVTEELKGIFNAENLPKLRTEARKMIRNNKTLAMFGMDKGITGPFAKRLQAELGEQLWENLKNFRHPRIGTSEMLSAFKDLVPKEFKPMFEETIKAINYSKANEWKKAKDAFGLADDIMWDHKVPSSVIDKGYADTIEFLKVNPTSKNFNERIKNAGFDRKINRLIKKYEGVNTLDQKVGVVEEMNKVKSDFSTKYGNYLEDVDIKLDKKGNLRFSSTAKPLTTKMDRVKMLQTSLQQEKFPTMNKTQQHKFLKEAGFKIDKCLSSGGRVNLKFGKGVNSCITGVIEAEQKAAQRGSKEALKKFSKFGKLARKGAWILGPLDIPIELAFALPHMLAGDKEAAKRATTFGLFGWGKDKLEEVKADSPEAYKYAKHMKDNEDYIDAYFSAEDAKLNLDKLKDLPEHVQQEKKFIYNDQKLKAEEKMNSIMEGYKGYYDEEGKFDVWGEAKGKSATQDYLIKDVTEKTDKGLDMKEYGGHGMNIALGLPWNFGMKEGIAPFKGGQPITNLKQHITQKGQPYWKQLEHATYEAGVPTLFDQYFTTADVRDPRDAYSDLPIKYASQLGKLEKEEMLRGLKAKGMHGTVSFKKMLEAQGIDPQEVRNVGKEDWEFDILGKRHLRASGGRAGYMGGGIASIRKPSEIPPERGGLRSIMINGKKY